MTFLSVVIPTYQRDATTAAAVASVVNQSLSCQYEIIVVDDGSAEPFRYNQVLPRNCEMVVVRHDQNEGPAAARNTGILLARGKLISFLDSDDKLVPGTLQKRIDTAKRHGLGTLQGRHRLVASGWIYKARDGKSSVRVPRSGTSDDLLRGCWFAPGSCLIMDTDFLHSRQHLFNPRLRRLEDYEFFARLGIEGAEVISDNTVGTIIARGAHRCTREISQALAIIRAHFRELFEAGSVSARGLNAVEAYLAYEEAHMHIRTGRLLAGALMLLRSYYFAPRLSVYPGPGWE